MNHEIIPDPDFPMDCICKWCRREVMELLNSDGTWKPCRTWTQVPLVPRRRRNK